MCYGVISKCVSLFLVHGGTISIAGGSLPATVELFYSDIPAVWLSFGLAVVSLFPTPIIVVAYLQPVREMISKILTCGRSSNTVELPKRNLITIN